MKLKPLFVLLGCIAFGSAAFAQAGSGTLSGPESLKIQRCAKGRANPSVAVALAANGAFTIGAYAGTSTTIGRVTRLSLDQASLALLDSALETNASNACGTAVTLTSLTITQSTLKVNKRRDRAKLQLKARGTGTSSQGNGNGKYRFKATGPWQVAQP
jgi:hypothetical protein